MGLCHCMTCRKTSGSAFMAFVIYPADRVTITGRSQGWSATPETERFFCPVCGSQVFDRDRQGEDEIEIMLGAFDAPNLFAPTYEAFAKHREGWLRTDHLTCFSENRSQFPQNRQGFRTGRTRAHERRFEPVALRNATDSSRFFALALWETNRPRAG